MDEGAKDEASPKVSSRRALFHQGSRVLKALEPPNGNQESIKEASPLEKLDILARNYLAGNTKPLSRRDTLRTGVVLTTLAAGMKLEQHEQKRRAKLIQKAEAEFIQEPDPQGATRLRTEFSDFGRKEPITQASLNQVLRLSEKLYHATYGMIDSIPVTLVLLPAEQLKQTGIKPTFPFVELRPPKRESDPSIIVTSIDESDPTDLAQKWEILKSKVAYAYTKSQAYSSTLPSTQGPIVLAQGLSTRDGNGKVLDNIAAQLLTNNMLLRNNISFEFDPSFDRETYLRMQGAYLLGEILTNLGISLSMLEKYRFQAEPQKLVNILNDRLGEGSKIATDLWKMKPQESADQTIEPLKKIKSLSLIEKT